MHAFTTPIEYRIQYITVAGDLKSICVIADNIAEATSACYRRYKDAYRIITINIV